MLERITEDEKLIKALRCDYERNCWEEKCPYLESSSYNDCNTKRNEHDAADVIEELISRVPKWISVKERLPQKGEVVIIVDENGYFSVAEMAVGRLFNEQSPWFYVNGEYEPCVEYWMPLPMPPKMEEKEKE